MNENNAAQTATKDIREGFELTYAADADDPACAADLVHFTNGWRACIMSQVGKPVVMKLAVDATAAIDLINATRRGLRAPVADECAAFYKGQHVCTHTGERGVIREIRRGLAKPYNVVSPNGVGGMYGAWEITALASAPVAGGDGALSTRNQPESRANAGFEGGTLPPVAAHAFRALLDRSKVPGKDYLYCIKPSEIDAAIGEAGLMVDMTPPATARDRWMYEQGRLAERDPRSHVATQASAPVAGEAQLSEYRRGVMDAFHLANMANANRQGRTAEETCAHLVRSLADLANGDAAPQASEAVRDALAPFAALEDADLIGTAFEGKGDDAEILHFHRTGKSVTLGDFRRARAALSAQPGAQKKGGSDAE